VSASMKFRLVAALCVGIGGLTNTASAITVEVAKKCDALMAASSTIRAGAIKIIRTRNDQNVGVDPVSVGFMVRLG
jgi:hypothetical protein